MPSATHGKSRDSLTEDAAGAQRQLGDLARAGISLDAVTDKLVTDGVQLFADAADKLLAAVAKKRTEILDRKIDKQKLDLGQQLEKKVGEIAEEWRKHGNIRKLWQRDKSLWTDADEDRWLGWLDLADDKEVASYTAFAEEIKRDGFKDAVLLGMGGSSLGPEVLAETFGHRSGWPRLRILDSTVPAQIEALEAELDLAKTLFIVSSKSGSTTEPNVLKDYFFKRVADAVGADKAGRHFIAVTDPGLVAGKAGAGAGLPPNIPRRSQHRRPLFGAVAVRSRAGGHRRHRRRASLLRSTRVMMRSCGPDVPPSENPGVALGIALGAAALARPRQDHDLRLSRPRQFRRLGRATVRGIDRQERQGPHPHRWRAARRAARSTATIASSSTLRSMARPMPTRDAKLAALEKAGQPVIRIVQKST